MTMNNQSPLVPQGSLLEQKNKGRARVKIAVFLVLAIHGVGLMALLMQGCKKEPDTSAATNAATSPEVTNTPSPTFVEPTNSPALAPNPLPAATNTVSTPPPVEPQQPAAPAATPAASDYVIVKGDTFSTIAKKFHLPTKSLLEANPAVEPTKLKIGQTIHIPAAVATALAMTGTIAAPMTDAGGSGQMYSVKSGDSLTRIASQFGVSVKALRSENSLKTDKIVVGQKLRIPGKTSSASASIPTAPTSTTSGQ